MPDFNRNRFARKPFGNKGGNRFDGPKQKFTTDCSKCGNVCEVPFRPNGKKPVFCSNCFVKDGDDAPRGDRRDFGRPSFDRPQAAPRQDNSSYEVKRELQAVNEKLERLIAIMEGAVRVEAEEAPRPAAKVAPKPAPKPVKPPKKVGKKK